MIAGKSSPVARKGSEKTLNPESKPSRLPSGRFASKLGSAYSWAWVAIQWISCKYHGSV